MFLMNELLSISKVLLIEWRKIPFSINSSRRWVESSRVSSRRCYLNLNNLHPPLNSRPPSPSFNSSRHLRLCVFSATNSRLITMLIELNCFFTLLWWRGYVKIVLFLALQTILARNSHRKRIFPLFTLTRCVCLRRDSSKNKKTTNLSSFHKSKLWIYRFFQSRFCCFLSPHRREFQAAAATWVS